MQIGRRSDYEPDSLRAMVSAYGRDLGNIRMNGFHKNENARLFVTER